MVAIAAPFTPIPNLKINIGSKTILVNKPAALITKGVLESPLAL